MLAIDPGPERSALVEFDADRFRYVRAAYAVNERIRFAVFKSRADRALIEYTPPYTQRVKGTGHAYVPKEILQTAFESGRMVEAWEQSHGPGDWGLINRTTIRRWLLGHTQGGDPEIRAAICDRFGVTAKTAKGTKKEPGPLYGIKGDLWAALAVAIVYCDQNRIGPEYSASASHGKQG